MVVLRDHPHRERSLESFWVVPCRGQNPALCVRDSTKRNQCRCKVESLRRGLALLVRGNGTHKDAPCARGRPAGRSRRLTGPGQGPPPRSGLRPPRSGCQPPGGPTAPGGGKERVASGRGTQIPGWGHPARHRPGQNPADRPRVRQRWVVQERSEGSGEPGPARFPAGGSMADGMTGRASRGNTCQGILDT